MPNSFTLVLLLVSVVGTTVVAIEEAGSFKFTTKRDNDRVVAKSEKNTSVISVHSPSGISDVVIERTGETWPDTIMLRLHLRGLENFQVTNGRVKLEASISSQDNTVRVWKEGKEESQLDAKSPYWMEVRRIGNDRKSIKAGRRKDGFFEMELPKAMLENNPKSISVHRIDFYR